MMHYVENSNNAGRKIMLERILQALKKQYGACRHYTPRQVTEIATKYEIGEDEILDVFTVVCTRYNFAMTYFGNDSPKYETVREKLSEFLGIAEDELDCRSVLELLTDEIDIDFEISDNSKRKKKSDEADHSLKYFNNRLTGILKDEAISLSDENSLESSDSSEVHEDVI